MWVFACYWGVKSREFKITAAERRALHGALKNVEGVGVVAETPTDEALRRRASSARCSGIVTEVHSRVQELLPRSSRSHRRIANSRHNCQSTSWQPNCYARGVTPESPGRMSFNSECLSTDYSREEFCLALKAAREGKGITLEEIADTTKIPAFMFAALERCDLSRWPKGFFRRSFFRDYAQMLSLPVSEACAQFARLFPDDEGAAPTPPTEVKPDHASAAAAMWRRIADGVARVVGWLRESAAEPPDEEPQERAWVTDARRVGPAPAREFRVRIKLPRV